MYVTAHIALGSNLGDRKVYLEDALQTLGQVPGIRVTKVSSFQETEPVGGPTGQGMYLNAVAEIETTVSPMQLLNTLLQVEHQFGRVRQDRFGPRTLDLDLLLYGTEVINEADLVVPHPRMHERFFVLAPLAEIAPHLLHPVLGLSIKELLQRLLANPPMHNSVQAATLAGRELTGLRALVTGSTSGIGKAMALELARAGANVLIHARRKRADSDELLQSMRLQNVQTAIQLADLHQITDCQAMIDNAWNQWAGLDIWINNAGADTLTGAANHWPFEQKLEELLAVDLKATMFLSREVGRRMKQQGSGVILNMGWDQADTGMEGDSGQLFAAVKGAIMSFSKSLALTLAPEVRVNCLAPGWIRTAWGENASRAWQERAMRETPLGRWGTPDDVARLARWAVSPGAAFINGQVLRVNGGAVR